MEEKLKNLIEKTLKNVGINEPKVVLEHPSEISNGDYSTNVALSYAKELGKNPKELAEKIVEVLRQAQDDSLSRIEIAGPGFINFYLSKEFFVGTTKEVLKEKENWGENKSLKSKKIFIDHTQPNPFKEFHIGHLMNNTIGESVSRILKTSSAKVKTNTYHGDKGLHVAKGVWAKMKKPELSWGEAYSYGSKEFENHKDEIIDLNKRIYADDPELQKLYKEGLKSSFNYFESMYERLGSQFDYHFLESQSGEIGKKLVLENIGNVFEKSEGAVVFKGENFEPKTHTRVFLNKEELPTYEAKELGLVKIKKDKFDFDLSITITGNEQDSFFKVTEVAIGEVFPELKGKLKHLSHGMLKLPTGKMSSRTGDVITAETLISQIKEKVLEKIKDRDFDDKEKEELSEIVAIGALKYSILRQAIGGDIIFDFEKSISFEGDSGPYLQYSAVRAKSVLEKAKELGLKAEVKEISGEINEVEKLLYRFPEVVLRAGEEFAPHYIIHFLTELAGSFNGFYAKEKIADSADKNSPYKIALTESFLQTMTNGLDLLGIRVPERM